MISTGQTSGTGCQTWVQATCDIDRWIDAHLRDIPAGHSDTGAAQHEPAGDQTAQSRLRFRLHPEWLDYDLTPVVPGVIKANFVTAIPHARRVSRLRLPFSRARTPAPGLAGKFLVECGSRAPARRRVAGLSSRIWRKDCGAIIVAILDRRGAAKMFARNIGGWIIEMVDQLVRTRPGRIGAGWFRRISSNPEFIAPPSGRVWQGDVEPRAAARPSRFGRAQQWIERWFPTKLGIFVSEMLFAGSAKLPLDVRPIFADRFAARGGSFVDVDAHGEYNIP